MGTTLLSALATAGVLGVTHAIEPDHIAGIASLTGEAGDSRLAALAGACFGAGHVALVGGWVAGAYLILGVTVFPDGIEVLGTAVAAVVLGALGLSLAVGGFRIIHRDGHRHDGTSHAHVHFHLPGRSRTHDHGHGVRSYLGVGLVGALFTLSPPASMIAFASTILPNYGPDVVAMAIGTYAVGITATMTAIGVGAGSAFGRLIDRPRVYGSARVVAGSLVVGLAGAMLAGSTPVL